MDSDSEGELVIDEDWSPSKSVKKSENNNDPENIIEPANNNRNITASQNAVKRKSTDTIEGPVKKTKR